MLADGGTVLKRVCFLTVVVVLTAGWASGGEKAEGTKYGDGVTLDRVVEISELLEDPDAYLSEKVRVEGVITGVCKKRGCWVIITDQQTGDGIRIKVEDGVIVFPPESMGRRATAQGVFDVVVPGEHRGHDARHEEGHTCQQVKNAQNKVFLIHGTGAVIY